MSTTSYPFSFLNQPTAFWHRECTVGSARSNHGLQMPIIFGRGDEVPGAAKRELFASEGSGVPIIR